MKLISYFSNISIPLIIVLSIGVGIKENKKVYDLFLEGIKEGMGIIIKLFPTILGIFIAVGMLRNSGIFEYVAKSIQNVTGKESKLIEILPLAMMKPISGSASLALGTELMKNFGVESKIGKIAATVMGSTETTIYIIAIYTNSIKIKKTNSLLIIALIADFIGIISSIVICNILF